MISFPWDSTPAINNNAHLSFLDSAQLSSPLRRFVGLSRQIQSSSQHLTAGGMSLQYVLPKAGFALVFLAPILDKAPSKYSINISLS